MKEERISVALVGIYDRPINLIPQLDPDFCKNLFGQPEITMVGIGQEGLVISTNNKPFPLVIIGLQKIAIKVANENDLAQCISAIQAEFAAKGLAFKFSAYGINYEYQFLNINQPAEEWMWYRFVQPKIKTKSKYQSCPRLTLRFGINDIETINLTVEPRIGVHDGIFVDINHHHSSAIEELSALMVKKHYAESVKIVEELLSDVILNNHE